jgi:hypothetical protein
MYQNLLASLLLVHGVGFSEITSVNHLSSASGVNPLVNALVEVNPSEINISSPVLMAQARGRRIEFANNASSATVEGSVVRGDRLVYMVGASRGQNMSINIASTQAQGGALFTVIDPVGTVLETGVSSFSRELTRSGDYQISVGGSRGNASFSLTVEIR